jgi:hypothetical protein
MAREVALAALEIWHFFAFIHNHPISEIAKLDLGPSSREMDQGPVSAEAAACKNASDAEIDNQPKGRESSMNRRSRWTLIAIAVVPVSCLLMVAGCSQTVAPSPNVVERISGQETPAVPQGIGFLKDYSLLKAGQKGQPEWIYKNPQAQWSNYTKVKIDPVTFIAGSSSTVSAEDQQKLANYFYNQLKKEIGTKAQIVDQSGPGVLKLQIALTDAEGATPGLRTISVVVPQARVLNMVQSVGTGSYAFVGSASCEGQVTDSVTGELLAEWIDKREGGMALSSALQWKWGDAENVMDYWAKLLADRYVELKSGNTPA